MEPHTVTADTAIRSGVYRTDERGRDVRPTLAAEELKRNLTQYLTTTFALADRPARESLERFLNEPGDGPIKAFTLRGIKESPPYLHDGRLLTLEDVVEFFNLVQGLRLKKEEKADLVAFLKCL